MIGSPYFKNEAVSEIIGLTPTNGNFIVGDGNDWVAESGATARTSLGLAIGSDVQAYGAALDDLSALGAPASDGQIIVATGAGAFAYETGATARASLGLTIGTNVQAYDAGLASLAGLTYASDSFIKVTATDTYAIRTIAETKTDLSLNLVENTALSSWVGTSNITTLGTIATGTWEATDVGIAHGGTGQSTQQAALDALTNVSGATNEHVLTKDTGTGNAIFKVVPSGADEKVKVDSEATAGYLGAANSDGVLRTGTGITYADGGDYVTLTPEGILGDGTAGRVLRFVSLEIADGTNASTLNCQCSGGWNGDAFAQTDNIGKGGTSGNFTLSATGKQLTLEAAGLTGNAVFATGILYNNATTDVLMVKVFATGNDVCVQFWDEANDQKDMTVLADTGVLRVSLIYVTDA